MFKLYGNENESQNHFSWDSIGDVEQGRQNLGEDMPVLVYRLFQYTIKDELTRRYGQDETIDIFRKAGELAGREFAANMLNLELGLNEFMEHLRDVLERCKIGILRVEQFDAKTGAATLTVGEDLDCSGLPVTGETVCNYDEGFIAGILGEFTKKTYIVTEVDCWSTGSRVCRFKAHVAGQEKKD